MPSPRINRRPNEADLLAVIVVYQSSLIVMNTHLFLLLWNNGDNRDNRDKENNKK